MTRWTRRAALKFAAMNLPLLAALPAAAQQSFPNRPLRLVVPYAPGGTADALARALAEHMRKFLGQPVVVDNKPGANTAIGAQMVATAAADGYSLLLATGSTMVTNPLMYAKLGYDPRDLTPVGMVAVAPLVVEVHPDVPAKDLAELIRLARAKPGRLNYASTGAGSVIHLASLLLESQAGVQLTHIPFKGSSPALAAVLSGEVEVFLDSIGSSMPLIKAGKLRALAVTTPKRLKVLPNVPTVAESGLWRKAAFPASTRVPGTGCWRRPARPPT
jgi:tripartite-type tricarboxylate transporter receptor subunit TctC